MQQHIINKSNTARTTVNSNYSSPTKARPKVTTENQISARYSKYDIIELKNNDLPPLKNNKIPNLYKDLLKMSPCYNQSYTRANTSSLNTDRRSYNNHEYDYY